VEADGVHADVQGAVDVLLEVIEKDGRFGSDVEPRADDAVRPRVGLATAFFVGVDDEVA